jgi:urate oxidase
MSQLSFSRYGKDNIRLYKVDKDPKTGIHKVIEQTVRILLEGDIDTA